MSQLSVNLTLSTRVETYTHAAELLEKLRASFPQAKLDFVNIANVSSLPSVPDFPALAIVAPADPIVVPAPAEAEKPKRTARRKADEMPKPKGPFYWENADTGAFGKVDKQEELFDMVASGPRVFAVHGGRYEELCRERPPNTEAPWEAPQEQSSKAEELSASPQETAVVSEADNPETGADAPTVEELRKLVAKKIGEGHRNVITGLIASHGSSSGISQIPEGNRAAFAAALEAL